jgi:hypothetical protein
MSLPNPTTISYNGYTFPVEASTKIASRFVYDAAGRTVVQTNLLLTVTADLLAGAAQDATLDNIRAALERPGGALTVTGLGFGTLSVNTANGSKDLAYGPTPQTLNWTNTGAGRAARIVWQCEAHVLGCVGAASEKRVMEATREITLATDAGGYLTRTFNGTIRIPLTRKAVGDRTPPDTVDAYFKDEVPEKLSSFDRTISRTVDASGARLTYTVTDTQRKGWVPPPGAVDASASQSLTSQGKFVSIAWQGTLSATYEIEATRSRAEAWPWFLQLMANRIGPEIQAGAGFVPISCTIGEPEIYGRQAASFSLTYALTLRPGRDASFPPAPCGGPRTHDLEEVGRLPQGPRPGPLGVSGYKLDAKDDKIRDLCDSEPIDGQDQGHARSSRSRGACRSSGTTCCGPCGCRPSPTRPGRGSSTRTAWSSSRSTTASSTSRSPRSRSPRVRLPTPNWNQFQQGGPPFRLEAQKSPAPSSRSGRAPTTSSA